MRPHAPGSWLAPALPALVSAALCVALPSSAGAVAFASRITSNNRIALHVTNHGVLGNNFVTPAASLEYPAGAGIEHLVHGGLWLGAHAVDGAGAFTGVVTGVVDVAIGTTTPFLTEFTPGGDAVLVRSSLPASPFYSPDAVSEEDLVAYFDDGVARTATSNPEPHRPMRIRVRQESYSWSWASLQDVVFLNFSIANIGTQPLTDAWAGLYMELASGNKAGYVSWPPTPRDPGGLGRWYGKKWLQYEDSLRMIREHYCAALPVPGGCILGRAPYWIGLQLLTPPGAGRQVTLAAWTWSPANTVRDEDVERYALMSAGTIQNLAVPALMPQTGDPVELLALGPFASIAPGDSIEVAFALVGGADEAEIHRHAIIAQRAHDVGYGRIVTPALLSLASAESSPDRVRLVWSGARGAVSATVERREEQGGWSAIGEAVADGLGSIAYEDATVTAGHRYGYRLAVREPQGTSYAGEAWVDVPAAAALALLGVRPNPVSGADPEVRFTLAAAAPATLEVFDLMGRRVWDRRVAGVSAGLQTLPLSGAGAWAPGVYVLRLTQGSRVSNARAVVTR